MADLMPNIAEDNFLYFGFASNMNPKRVKANVPDAKFVSLGILKNYSLVFRGKSSTWQGATASLKPEEGSTVWGVIWRIPQKDLDILNRQEGVLTDLYKTTQIEVETPSGNVNDCMFYESTQSEEEGLPSDTYMQTIIDGATEHKLPEAYISNLKSFETNGVTHEFPGDKENVA